MNKRLHISLLFVMGTISTLVITTRLNARVRAQKDPIAVIGTGYVGLVTGAGLAEFGNTVICADIDERKIAMLHNGIMPIYEPGLKELVARNVQDNTLTFTTDVDGAIQDASIIFIAVGTPMGDDGSADLRALKSVARCIARNMNSHKIIVTKSTVPVGTGASIRRLLEDECGVDGSMFDMVSNPEFLREGTAVHDFLKPDRLVIGADSDYAFDIVCDAYAALLAKGVPCVLTNVPTAEIIKYASNAFLATKLSFINEIANLCDATGGHVHTVSEAMGLDHRIAKQFLQPGPGYGGSCFPKDTQALVHMAEQHNVDVNTVVGAIITNKAQKKIPVQKLLALTNGDIQNKTIAVLGLAFKANTDDIRYSPALTTVKELLKHGAQVKAYDPEAMANTRQEIPNITYCASVDETIQDADALMIMTEWDEFKQLRIEQLAAHMRGRVIIDARNLLNIQQLKSYGFVCDGIGQACQHCA